MREKSLTKPELGHLKKADAPPHAPPRASSATRPASWQVGDDRHRRGLRGRPGRQDLRHLARARASRARSSATTSRAAPSPTARTTCARPGSIGASATPSRVFKGIRGPGRMGGKRVTQSGLTVVELIPTQQPAARARLGARARRAAPWRCAPMARRLPSSAAARRSTLDDASFGAPLQRAARARGRARRAQRAPPRHRRDARRAARSRGGGAKPWRQKGTGRARAGSSARRSGPAAASSSARSRATTPSRSTARRAAPRCAARCRCTPSAGRSPCSTPATFDAPSTKQAAELLADWAAGGSVARRARRRTRPRAGKSFRNLARVERAAAPTTSASPTSSAPRRCSSPQAALDAADRAAPTASRDGDEEASA